MEYFKALVLSICDIFVSQKPYNGEWKYYFFGWVNITIWKCSQKNIVFEHIKGEIVQDLRPRSTKSAQPQRRNHHLSKDTWRSINDDAATLYLEWGSLQEEGPPHVNIIE